MLRSQAGAADRGGRPLMINESRKEGLEESEHHLSNLQVGRPMPASAGSASNLHELSRPSRAASEHQMAFAHIQDNWLTKLQHRTSEPNNTLMSPSTLPPR